MHFMKVKESLETTSDYILTAPGRGFVIEPYGIEWYPALSIHQTWLMMGTVTHDGNCQHNLGKKKKEKVKKKKKDFKVVLYC